MDEAQEMRSDPAHPARLIHRQGEVNPVRVLHHHSSFEPAETGERITQQPDGSRRFFLVSDHQVSLEVPALGAKCTQPPVQPARLIHVDGAGTDVVDETAEPATLKRTQRAKNQVVAQKVAHQEPDSLSSAVAGDEYCLSCSNIESQPPAV